MAARRAARGETGSLRVGFTSTATFNVVVPSAIRTFRRAYPEIHLTLEEANTTPLITGLREGTLDVVYLRPGTSGTEELQLRRLSDDPIVVALPKRHPAAALEEIDLAILKDDPFLLFPWEIAPTLYDTIVDACRKAGFQPVIGQVAPHITSIVNLVAAELGVSLVPAAMMQLRVTGIVYRQIAGQSPTTRLALAYRQGETSPVVAQFRRPRRFVMLSGRWRTPSAEQDPTSRPQSNGHSRQRLCNRCLAAATHLTNTTTPTLTRASAPPIDASEVNAPCGAYRSANEVMTKCSAAAPAWPYNEPWVGCTAQLC